MVREIDEIHCEMFEQDEVMIWPEISEWDRYCLARMTGVANTMEILATVPEYSRQARSNARWLGWRLLRTTEGLWST